MRWARWRQTYREEVRTQTRSAGDGRSGAIPALYPLPAWSELRWYGVHPARAHGQAGGRR